MNDFLFTESDPCPCDGCSGTLEMTADDCVCNAVKNPPCWQCVNPHLACISCGWVPGDDLTAHEQMRAIGRRYDKEAFGNLQAIEAISVEMSDDELWEFLDKGEDE